MNRKCDAFFERMENLCLALSFNDVRLKSDYSEILPAEAVLETNFSRNVRLKIPIVSSPMDTVTEAEMAIAMAKFGGLGIIHKAMTPKEQSAAVSKVKHSLNGLIPDPICIHTKDTLKKVIRMREDKGYEFFSFPVKDSGGKIVGQVTKDVFEFCLDEDALIEDLMSKDIIRAPSTITIEGAYTEMMRHRKNILPIFNGEGFEGIYTLTDVKRIIKGDHHGYNVDSSGSLRVGAAIGVGSDTAERLEMLNKQKVNVLVIDTAHGNSKAVINTIRYCKDNYPHIDVVAGNISEGEAAKRLVDAGVDGIRVGQGPGSICTTRIIAGIGCPQVTAVYNVEKAVRGSGVPICGDGGIEVSGDIAIALGAGANTVMLGNLLAGTKEAPGEIVIKDGKQVKMYRGMGSLSALLKNKASRERYGQENISGDKLVPEGVEDWVPYKGELSPIILQLLGGLRSGMGYIGAKNIDSLHERADFWRISPAGLKESHPHGLNSIENKK